MDELQTLIDKWDLILSTFKEEHEIIDVSFKTWIKPLKIYKLDGNVLTLTFSSLEDDASTDERSIVYIEKRYLKFLEVTVCEVMNKEYQVIIMSSAEKKEDELKKKTSSVSTDNSLASQNLNPNYTFDTFVVGKNNELAHATALAVASDPGDYGNPLFIYGGVGLGKTHLMHAIGNYIVENSNRRVLYVTSDEFINDFIGINKRDHNGTNFNHVDFFKNKYRNIDVLIIDDIQFLGGATQTQQEFFHTFNTLYSDSKQIIISSDRSPDDLKLLEDRLRTRFCWGLTVNIFPPDFNLRVEIIKRKIIAGNFEKEISEDVIEYIASNMGSDVRQLEGSITRLVAYSAIMGGSEINLELAIEALKDFISKGISEKNDVHRIQKVVAEYFQISVEDIRSKKRSSNIAFPRQIAMYLCRKLTSESFPKIGTEFGGKDHSTVMHSVEKIENEIKVNPDLANIIEKIKEDIQ